MFWGFFYIRDKNHVRWKKKGNVLLPTTQKPKTEHLNTYLQTHLIMLSFGFVCVGVENNPDTWR